MRQLYEIYDEIYQCQKCRLCEGRTTAVPGFGNPGAQLMLIGEALGADESRIGVPFVGKAGQLLTDMLHAIDLSRQRIYLTNCVKCRPPENRNPLVDEIVACQPYTEELIQVIQPKILCIIGRHAMKAVLGSTEPISKVRGQWRDYHGIYTMVIYHPAYLLRNPNRNNQIWQDTWKDLQEIHRMYLQL